MAIQLTLACNTYDRTRALQDGTVRAEGIELNYLPLRPGELFRRQARHAEFDVAEFSLSTHALLLARGDRRMVGVPVFPSRMFRHSNIFVRGDGQVQTPGDLAGRRIGVMEYQQTAVVWIRGILQHEYGVSAADVEWYTGPYQPGSPDVPRIAFELHRPVRLETAPPGRTLSEMLASGEIDALIGAQPPKAFQDGSGDVVRLVEDYQAVELAYYQRTGIFPIMHLLVVRREIYERSPWVAASLFKAFVQAKAVGFERLNWPGASYCSLPWLGAHLDETRAAMGEDPYAYGLEKNRHVVETFLSYIVEHGLLEAAVSADDLFVPETHSLTDPAQA